jgi:hypothetical protein
MDLLHTGASGSAADESDNVPLRNRTALDRIDRRRLSGEDASGTGVTVDICLVDKSWIDGRAFDNASFRRQVASREADR